VYFVAVSTYLTSILGKIETGLATISIIGLGYVGLPLAVAFAKAGFRVIGIDVDQAKVNATNWGDSFVQDVRSESLRNLTCGEPEAPFAGRLSATTDCPQRISSPWQGSP